ncbi:MAG: hypothetical protein COU33_03265 [Candidatus Magasanikbacteria bacterium CG10_big_fil_rev_8_21_14_0_10_43_6]|uniref:Uncharacterized protein n=1 Tax=Candidatus Magasanikbacteria bacterium CG10_big_fil_rev_8_21_14_0_10_43_6 TaxID=1974650 RepID=A0A2M6W0T4_9BACT|nr:MAG: hypothetical protein COU33_03265 [Candidatus Magasanikbacteria bacterium CG10_big_fil_rev_8_21_14_0_10_43_6]
MEGNTQVLQDILHIVTHIKDNAVSQEEFLDFKKEMYEFRDEMTGFKSEMYEFRDEMTSFKVEMTGFKQDSLEFQAEMMGFKKETRNNFTLIEQRLDTLTSQSLGDTTQNARDILLLGKRVKQLERHGRGRGSQE